MALRKKMTGEELKAQEARQAAEEITRGLASMNPDGVPLNFQKLEIIEAKIRSLEKKRGEMVPKLSEDARIIFQRKIGEELKILERKRAEIRTAIYNSGEPAADPVKAVLEKYEWMEVHNLRRRKIAAVIKGIEDLIPVLEELDQLWIPVPYTCRKDRRQDLNCLMSIHFNYSKEFGQMQPMTEASKRAEIAEAAAQVAELMVKVQKAKELEADLAL